MIHYLFAQALLRPLLLLIPMMAFTVCAFSAKRCRDECVYAPAVVIVLLAPGLLRASFLVDYRWVRYLRWERTDQRGNQE